MSLLTINHSVSLRVLFLILFQLIQSKAKSSISPSIVSKSKQLFTKPIIERNFHWLKQRPKAAKCGDNALENCIILTALNHRNISWNQIKIWFVKLGLSKILYYGKILSNQIHKSFETKLKFIVVEIPMFLTHTRSLAKFTWNQLSAELSQRKIDFTKSLQQS